MDPRKEWMLGPKKKTKKKRKPPAITLPPDFWKSVARSAPTLLHGDPYEEEINRLVRKTRGVRERNELFRDELLEMMDVDTRMGTYNRQSRINRGNQIVHQIRQNDALLDELQNEMDEIESEYDDISSVPRR